MKPLVTAYALVGLSLMTCAATFIGCTVTPKKADSPQREVASLQNRHPQNVAVLKALPLMPKAEVEARHETQIAEGLTNIFASIQDESRAKQSPLMRGTHAKGSCFDGQITIFDSSELQNQFKIPEAVTKRLAHSLFATPSQLPVFVRFANAKGSSNSDKVGDVRGMSFAIDTHGRAPSANGDFSQDFMMNSSPMFAVNNIQEFYELMKASRIAQGKFHYIPNPLYFGAIRRATKLLAEYERNDTVSFAAERYWSNLPYSLGLAQDGSPAEIAKFKLEPCSGKPTPHAPNTDKADDYLQADIAERARKGDVCFYLQAQLFDLNKMNSVMKQNRKLSDWIEEAGELWDERILPFYTVAKIEVTSAQARSCDDKAFSTRIHSTRDLQPLGALARVRAIVEETSRARRMGEK